MSDTANRPIPFDAAFNDTLHTLLSDRYGHHFEAHETLSIHGELAHGHALASLALADTEGMFRLELETCVELEPNDIDSPIDARHIALDALDALFGDFLEAQRRLDGIYDAWGPHDFQGIEVLVRGRVTAPALDAAADRLLAADDASA